MGRVIADWPSLTLIAAYEMLMRPGRLNASRAGAAARQARIARGPLGFAGQARAEAIALEDRVVGRPPAFPVRRKPKQSIERLAND